MFATKTETCLRSCQSLLQQDVNSAAVWLFLYTSDVFLFLLSYFGFRNVGITYFLLSIILICRRGVTIRRKVCAYRTEWAEKYWQIWYHTTSKCFPRGCRVSDWNHERLLTTSWWSWQAEGVQTWSRMCFSKMDSCCHDSFLYIIEHMCNFWRIPNSSILSAFYWYDSRTNHGYFLSFEQPNKYKPLELGVKKLRFERGAQFTSRKSRQATWSVT